VTVLPQQRISLDPPRPINEMALYGETGWNPHEGQQRVILARERQKVVSAGRRFGKSEIGGHKLTQEALNTRLVKSMLEDLGKRREFWVVGPSYTDSEKEFRILWNELARLGFKDYFDRPGSYNNPQTGDMHLSLWEGKFQVHAKSEKHPDSLVGEGLSGVVLAEAAKLKESTYNKLIRPTLADFLGWCLMTSTPEGKNWFYRMWKRGQDPLRPDWWSMRAPSWLNPYVYPRGATDDGLILLRRVINERDTVIDDALFERLGVDPEIAALAADLTEEAFNQEIGAMFTEFVGRVFKEFDEDIHVGDFDFEPGWETVACVDYGFTNPNVWLLCQIDPHGERVRVLDEVYETGLTNDEFADAIEAAGLCPSGLRYFYPDPADPGATRVLEKRLKIRHKSGTGGEIKHRIDAIRRALKVRNTHRDEGDPVRVPLLQFDRRCVKTINDFLNYRYPEKKTERAQDSNAPENPMKKDDHGPEAVGRLFAGRFGTPQKERRSRATKADVSG
jgi:hypothetical protein